MCVEPTRGPLKESPARLHPGIWLNQSLGSGSCISLAFQQTLRGACVAGSVQHGLCQRTMHGICGTFWMTATCTEHIASLLMQTAQADVRSCTQHMRLVKQFDFTARQDVMA